jgi:peptide/nickel transport system ATP-binding protein
MTDGVSTERGGALLAVEGLRVVIGAAAVVEGAALRLAAGRVTGIVGESGSGKSQFVAALTGLNVGAREGTVRFQGKDLGGLDERGLRAVRGSAIAYVFQDPTSALNPFLTVGAQLTEVARHHLRMAREAARASAAARLADVGLPPGTDWLARYPHELSGGQAQRVAIAMALMGEPEILVADEPTTALDVTVQKGVLELIRRLADERGLAAILVSHDLAAVAHVADEVCVMHAGRIVEAGAVGDVLRAPRADYTRGLIAATPRLSDPAPAPRPSGATLVEVRELSVTYAERGLARRGRGNRAVRDVSFTIGASESVGLVGESGSGKSTVARALLGLSPVTAGRVLWRGADLAGMAPAQERAYRRSVQMVFQDPYAALNPRMSVRRLIAEPLWTHRPDLSRREMLAQVERALSAVRLPSSFADRLPRQLSGGQAQRVNIARSIVSEPELLICDEAVSALDVSVQAEILALLERLRDEMGLAMLFITHDLAVVRRMADRIVVMRSGEIVETAAAGQLFDAPGHTYTRALLDSVLSIEATP